jgi:ABC-2 type transport system ATP-binding protein
MTLAIEAEGLVKSFKTTRAVDGVDLAVARGSVYGVLGPNGAGKTTTIKMLATLLKPDGGSARVLGRDVVAEAGEVRGLVSLTGQLASVDDDLTGRENLILLARLFGYRTKQAKLRADELLGAFGLEDAENRLVKNFSGGMRRRLDIAASIVVTPALMFLDEPTTGLDPRSRNQVWDIVRALVGEGTTVLLCTQYLDEADQLADRIAVIDRGVKVAEGTSDELKTSVGRSTLTLGLVDPTQIRVAAEIAERLIGEQPTLSPEAQRLSLPLQRSDQVVDVLVTLRERGIHIDSVNVQKPSLDEVFMVLTGHHAGDEDADPESTHQPLEAVR